MLTNRLATLAGVLFSALALAAAPEHADAFLSSSPDQSLVVSAEVMAARGARVTGEEKRLGVPTFIFIEGVSAETSAEATARSVISRFADAYRLDAADVKSLSVRELHQNDRSGTIVRFAQQVNGIDVFRSQFDVVLSKQGVPVAVSGYPAPSDFARTASTHFRVGATQALERAFREQTGANGTFKTFASTDGVWMTASLVENSGFTLSSPARARRVYYVLNDRLEPAWHIELDVATRGSTSSAMYASVVSATDGARLMRHNLTADASYKVFANTPDLIPFDGPFGNDVTPHPTGTPDGFQPPFVARNLVTVTSAPFSRNDPWLASGAVTLTGNNVDAYADLASPDGFSPSTSDFRVVPSSPGLFDYPVSFSTSPAANVNQQSAAITQLFYNINFLHDWFYDSGFDERAGNAQTTNYGRGGREGDFIRGEAQDSSGRNNANMSTPSDGASPRMQMYIFDGLPQLNVNSPAGIAGRYDCNTAAFGASAFDLTANVIRFSTTTDLGCTPYPAGTFTGGIALIDRGTCGFVVKAANAQAAGAIGVIIATNAAGAAPGMAGVDPTVTIPSMSTTQAAGALLRATTGTITVNMKRSADLDRDGSFDNQIVAHEWAHYLSNRLIGDGVGLINNQGRSMGEGWSDTVAMIMSVRDEDRLRAGNNTFQGVYASAAFVTTGGVNNGAYFGIRRLPYSTNLAKNPLTLRHIANGVALPTGVPLASGADGAFNGEVHNAGEIWSNMLWECYASLLNAYPFVEAQDRMKGYLVAGLKLTPISPTMLEARDALLAAALAADPADYQRFVSAFAKRGAGFGAVVPDRNVVDHIGVIESFETGAAMRVVSATINDDATSCDRDGVLDLGEVGNVRVRVKNVGRTVLASQTLSLTASGATSTMNFPNGNTATIPSLQPGAEATVSVRMSINSAPLPTIRAGLTATFDEPSLPTAQRTVSIDPRLNTDDAAAASSTDAFDTRADAWTSVGFTRENGYAHANDLNTVSDLTLTSPWLSVNATGNFIVTFKERHSFEWDGTRFWDGAVVEFSTDGVTWVDPFVAGLFNPGYTGNLQADPGNPLAGRRAYVNLSPGFPAFVTRTLNFGAALAGQSVRLRIRVGSDGAAAAYGIDVDDFTVTNAANAPFTALANDSVGTCNQRPVAIAPSFNAVEGTLSSNVLTRNPIRLNGTSSVDPDGAPLTYAWTQLGGSSVTLTGANTATPSFVATVPAAGAHYTFQLVVNDGTDSSLPARVEMDVSNVNQLPVAVAVGPATIAERSGPTVTLDGSTSTDADGEMLTFTWSQTAGPTVALSSTTAMAPTFALPEVTADTTFTFKLVANDGTADSAAATVSVLVTNVDRAPTANAGVDVTSPGRVSLQLTATGADPEGDAITFAWTQVSGTSAMLSNPATATVSIATPNVAAAEDLVFRVTATANSLTATDDVTVHVLADQAPSVNAGADFPAAGRTLVNLSGAASDAEGDAITWAWSQVSGTSVTLTGATTSSPTFTSPDIKTAEPLEFSVTVTANGRTATDTVTVTVAADRAPTVSVADVSADARTTATLAATAADAEGDVATFTWEQVSGTVVTLTGQTTAAPTFTAPEVASGTEALVFRVTATANGLTATDEGTVTVRAANRQPVVSGLNDVSENERVSLTLSAVGMDPDQDVLTWAWSQLGGPQVTLAGATTGAVTFTTPEVREDTVIALSVVATDPTGETATATVRVTVKNVNRAPVAVASSTGSVGGERVVLNASNSTDPDGDSLTAIWKQTGGPEVTLENAGDKVASFIAPKVEAATEFTFEVEVSDGTLKSSVPVVVSIQAAPKASGCGCSSGAGLFPLALLALSLRSRRRRKN